MLDTVLHVFGFCGDNATHPDLMDLFGQFSYVLQEIQITYFNIKK